MASCRSEAETSLVAGREGLSSLADLVGRARLGCLALRSSHPRLEAQVGLEALGRLCRRGSLAAPSAQLSLLLGLMQSVALTS
eukprot:CAMPEP_0178414754 /NCGR_PEP_ID=MMETSP0689_2-20121128/23199_2 /TAXON_ID=160604 /ORGANISM="Amphidinium massartii, Strain CS-259" /LENGTH=82 /DNA_ID=CAMNT_0020036053 /DNA_START=229 /DNA_END=477 /DNA_ORIENTATION=-